MKTSYDQSDDAPPDEVPTDESFDHNSKYPGNFHAPSEYGSVASFTSREDESVSSWDTNTLSGTENTVCEDVNLYHEAENVLCEEEMPFHEVFARCKPYRNAGQPAREEVVSLREELETNELRQVAGEVKIQQESSLYDLVSPEGSFRTIEVINRAQNWSDSLVSLPVESAGEPVSEMYYTASSEVSLLSDTDAPLCADKTGDDSVDGKEVSDERKDCVIAGHVAAMRERFESMTRTNTPCPDSMMRSMSPSLDVFRNITPSPDRLG